LRLRRGWHTASRGAEVRLSTRDCAVKHLSDAKTFLLEALGTGKKAPIAPSDIDEVIEELRA